MRTSWIVVGAVCLGLVAREAEAAWIAKAAGGDARLEEVRLAHVEAPLRSVVFTQLLLADVRGETAWIVPVPEGASLELGSPRWFPSLEAATAPVLAPVAALQCGVALRSTADDLGAASVRPVARALGMVPAREAPDRLTAAGFAVDDATRSALLAEGGTRVALLVLAPWMAGPTVTVRVVGGPRPTVPLGLPGPRLRHFGIGPARPGVGRPEIEPAFGALTWGSGGSNWPSVLSAAEAEAAASGAVVATFAARDGLFSDQALVGGATLGSVVRRYATSDACATRAAAFALHATPLPVPCPRTAPWPGAEPAPACTAVPSELDDLVCDGADDLAVAFGGTTPRELWLSRLIGTAGGTIAPGPTIDGTLRSFHQVLLPGTPACDPGGPPSRPPTTPPSTPPTTPPPATGDDATADACGAVASGLAEGCAASAADGSCTSSTEGGAEDSADGCGGDPATDSTEGCRAARGKRVRAWPLGYGLVAIAAVLRRRRPRRGLRETQG